MNKNKLFLMRIFIIWLFSISFLAKAGEFKNEILVVFEGQNKAEHEAESYKKKWENICTSLISKLENRGYVLGRGPFESARCADRDMTFDQVNRRYTEGFFLRVFDFSNGAGFEIFHKNNNKMVLEARLNYAVADQFLEMLEDESILNLIVLYLEDQLPYMSIIKLKNDQKELKIQEENILLEKSDKLAIFSLKYDDERKSFWPMMYGIASLNEDKKGYTLNVHEDKINSHRVYFVQDSNGRGQHSESIKALLLEKQKSLNISLNEEDSKDKNSFASGVFTVRYGYPLIISKDVVAQTKFFSTSIEKRGGVFKGLRLYYDAAPKIIYHGNGVTEQFGWSRINLGYVLKSTNLSKLSNWIDSWDFVPRIGLFSVEADVAVGREKIKANFLKKDDIDIGFETGVEKGFGKLNLRYWLGANSSFSETNKNRDSYLSLKTGLNSSFQLYKFDELRSLDGLFFAVYEQVKNERKRPPYNDMDYLIYALSFRQAFAGFGGSFSW